MRKKAIVYCRISTQQQSIKHNTFSTQEESCRQWAEKEEVDIEYVCTDIASGDDEQRSGLSELLGIIDANVYNLKYVIVSKADRLARSAEVGANLVKIFREHQIEFINVQQPNLRGEDSYDQFLLDAAKGKLYKENISQQTRNAVNKKIHRGEHFGRILKGYKLVNSNGRAKLVKDVKHSGSIKKMFELASEGNTVKEIQKKLINQQFPKIPETTIRHRLKNKKYAGFLKYKDGKYFRGNIEPIVSEDLFEKAQKLIKSSKKRKKRKNEIKYKKLLPLRKWLICNNCNKPFSGSRIYYNCPRCKINRKNTIVHEELRKFLNGFDFFLPYALGFFTSIYEYFLIFTDQLRIILREIEESKKKITDKITDLNKKVLNIDIEDEGLRSVYLKEKEKLEEMKIEKTELINQIPYVMQEAEDIPHKFVSYNLGEMWNNNKTGQIRMSIQNIFPDGIQYDGTSFNVNKDNLSDVIRKVPGKSNIKRVDDYLQELFKSLYVKSEKGIEYKKEKNLIAQRILYNMVDRRCKELLTKELSKKILKKVNKEYKGDKDKELSKLIQNIR